MYIGAEVIAGDSIGLYGQHLKVAEFGILTSYTMGFMVLGYLLGILLIPRVMSQRSALVGSALAGLVFTLGIMLGDETSMRLSSLLLEPLGIMPLPDPLLYLALLGFANALVWPAVWPLALEGLGHLTAVASALLIMGIAGGALLPLLYGAWCIRVCPIKAPTGSSFPAMMILYYAVAGHKLRAWSGAAATKALID